MKNMAFKVIDRLFLVVYGTKDPTDDEWRAYIADVERHGIDRTMQLVFTEGGGPTAPQRRFLEELLAGRTVPVAVMTSSSSIRLMVTAMSWVNREIRSFPPTGLYDALAYLEIPASRAELIEREIKKLRCSLGSDARATA
jgi:hypothetical protein